MSQKKYRRYCPCRNNAQSAINIQEIKFYVIANYIKKIQSIGLKVMENKGKDRKTGDGWTNASKNLI